MIWENGKSVAKIEEEDGFFTCVKFSKDLRFEEIKVHLDQDSLNENLNNWDMKLSDKVLALEEKK